MVSPDVFVVFGVIKRQRRIYKTWEKGGKVPAFILEITSRTTRQQDEVQKPQLYAQLGVQEYFQYDPPSDYLQPQLKGRTLVDGRYQPLPLQEMSDGRWLIRSVALGLDLCLPSPDGTPLTLVTQGHIPQPLRLYDPKAEEKLLNYAESVTARNQERERAAQEREQAEQAEQARQAPIPKPLAVGMGPEQIAEALGLTIEAINEQMRSK